MPSGRVRWFDANKGYGFIQNEQGADVFLPAAALPEGVKTLRKGAKVEYSVVEGRRGPQAMGLTLVASAPSLVKATRPKPDDMAADACRGRQLRRTGIIYVRCHNGSQGDSSSGGHRSRR